MSRGIFHIERDGSLVELTEQPYESEDHIQALLSNYPALLSGSQIDPEEPRRWLLVTRESGVPDDAGAPNRWSLDHLFLDQEGIPTLVEVKRSSDTRIRREVVGQMMDYAANGVAHWPVETVRAQFEARCAIGGIDPAMGLSRFLDGREDPAAFWEKVKTNLQAGRVRMLFVADVIPAELRRIVEFLNKQMDPAEVLAVEIRQFVCGEVKTLVPQVFGRVESKKSTSSGPARQWDESSFVADLKTQEGDGAVAGAQALLSWARRAKVDVKWGEGSVDGSFVLYSGDINKNPQWLVSCYTYGKVEVLFQRMKMTEPFRSLELREDLRRRLNGVPGVDIQVDKLERRPRIRLDSFASPDTAAQFAAVLDWVLEQRRAWERSQPSLTTTSI